MEASVPASRLNSDIEEMFQALFGSVLDQPQPTRRLVAKIPERQHVLDRVLSHCETPEGQCWEWRGASAGSKGYGRIKIHGKLVLPHRATAWAMGKIDSLSDPERKLCVLHRCDNQKCVNPDHLFVGSLSDNMQDCSRKGRMANQKNPWKPKPPKKVVLEPPPMVKSRQVRIPVMHGYEKRIGPFGFEEDAPIIRDDVYERPAKARINDGIEEWHLLPRTPETQKKNPVTDPTEKDR